MSKVKKDISDLFFKYYSEFNGKSLMELKAYFPECVARWKTYKKTKTYQKRKKWYDDFATKTIYDNYDDYMLYFRGNRLPPFLNIVGMDYRFKDELIFFDKHHMKRR
jgi:hypothetical protein